MVEPLLDREHVRVRVVNIKTVIHDRVRLFFNIGVENIDLFGNDRGLVDSAVELQEIPEMAV